MSDETVRREVMEMFANVRPAFEALVDQGICEIRNTGPETQRSLAIMECAVAFSDVDRWTDTFYPLIQKFSPTVIDREAGAVMVGELHRMFLAYLMSLCLHRVVWP